MVPLRATTELRYAGVTLHAGDAFEATDRDARLLKAIGKAVGDGSLPNRTDLPVLKSKEAPVEPEAPLPGLGAYQRRDLRAEDGRSGEASAARSSRRARPRKEPALPDSGDDAG